MLSYRAAGNTITERRLEYSGGYMINHNPPAGAACWDGCHFIGNNSIDETAAPFFRKTFTLEEEPVSAVVFLCGLGFHEFYVNGVKAGDSFLTPAQSIYDRRAYYNTYDIMALLTKGENTFEVILGNSLFNCPFNAWGFDKAPWRGRPRMAFYGEITVRGGKETRIYSNPSFETGASNITYNTFYGGETQDYTRSLFGSAKFGGAETKPAAIVKSPGGVLSPFPEPHVKEQETLEPVKITNLEKGKKLYDFGRNMAGWAHVDAAAKAAANAGANAGGKTRFTLRYGEVVGADGSLDTSHISSLVGGDRFQTDEYILDAEHPVVDGRPHFTYYGFRYVELAVEEGELAEIRLRAVTLNTDLKPIGAYDSSDDYVNRINTIGQRASLSNLVNVPTDCPQREKNGWTGDAALSAEQMCLNMDMREMFRRWLTDIRDSQRPSGQLPGIIPTGGWGFNWGSGPVWDSVLFELPLAIYICYGDSSLLLENRDAMKRYLEFCTSMAEDHVVGFGLGDWCPPKGKPGDHLLPARVSDTAAYYKMAGIAALASAFAGAMADRLYFEDLAAKIKDSFNRHFVNAAGEVTGNCQTGQGMALVLGLVEGALAEKAGARLVSLVEQNDCRLDFGMLGAKYVFEALSRQGRGQLALDMILREGYPSYRHWLDTGATTMAENWNRTASDNHHMFSDVIRWFFRFTAGLGKPDFGKSSIVFTPDFLSPLTHAEAYTETPAGKFACRWERLEKEAGKIRFTCTVPSTFTAFLSSPDGREYRGSLCEKSEKGEKSGGAQTEQTWIIEAAG